MMISESTLCPSRVSVGFSLFCNFNFSLSSTSISFPAAVCGGWRRILVSCAGLHIVGQKELARSFSLAGAWAAPLLLG